MDIATQLNVIITIIILLIIVIVIVIMIMIMMIIIIVLTLQPNLMSLSSVLGQDCLVVVDNQPKCAI